MKYIALLITAGLLAGCQDDLTTADPATTVTPSAEFALTAEAAAHAQIAIDDALDRIVPTLGDANGARDIGSALGGLRNALATGHAEDNAALTDLALKQVERYAQLSGAEQAELDAVRLAIHVATTKSNAQGASLESAQR